MTIIASMERGVAEFVSDNYCYYGEGCSRVCQRQLLLVWGVAASNTSILVGGGVAAFV